jgi:hypothetical protein
MVIYLTFHKVTDAKLVKIGYEKADAKSEAIMTGAPAYTVIMEDLLSLAERQEALEATTLVHTKKAPWDQTDSLKAVKTAGTGGKQNQVFDNIKCYKCGKMGRYKNDCTESVTCLKYNSKQHIASTCRNKAAEKPVDKKKEKKDRQKETEEKKKAELRAREKKKKAKAEKHKANKLVAKRRRKSGLVAHQVLNQIPHPQNYLLRVSPLPRFT